MIKEAVDKLKGYSRFLERKQPDFDQIMGAGYYWIEDKRPDLAQQDFSRAIRIRPDNTQALFMYGLSLIKQDRLRVQSLDERVWYEHDGTTYRDQVASLHQKISKLASNADDFDRAACLAYDIGDVRTAIHYWSMAIQSKPDNDLLIVVGRRVKTLEARSLIEKIEKELRIRKLAVHLYPL